jgi:hypothetical protein
MAFENNSRDLHHQSHCNPHPKIQAPVYLPGNLLLINPFASSARAIRSMPRTTINFLENNLIGRGGD